jgi:hypothetical protein
MKQYVSLCENKGDDVISNELLVRTSSRFLRRMSAIVIVLYCERLPPSQHLASNNLLYLLSVIADNETIHPNFGAMNAWNVIPPPELKFRANWKY